MTLIHTIPEITSEFDVTIDSFDFEPNAIAIVLIRAQSVYEFHKLRHLKIVGVTARATLDRKLLKRTIINDLTARDVAVTRAEKEYADDPRWEDAIRFQDMLDTLKGESETYVSIARSRLATLRTIARLLTDDDDAEDESAELDASVVASA
jgi:hypothetical protein